MRVFAKAIAAAVVMVSCAHAQIPAADAVATFRVGGVDFKLPLPSGYCLPVDKYIDVAQVVAATDNQNVTDLTAYVCDVHGQSAKYPILVKTPKHLLLTDIERKDLLSQMGVEFDKPEFAAAIASGEMDKSEQESISTVLGDTVTVKSEVKPIGRDDTCAYLAGTVSVGDKDGSNPVAMLACITAVRKRVLLLYAYGPFSGPNSIVALAPRVRALAQTLIKQNE